MDEKLLSLLDASCWSAELHSSFKGALNMVDTTGNLIVLLPASCCDGPHRVVLDVPRQFSFMELPLSRGDRFEVDGQRLCSVEKVFTVDFGRVRAWTDRAPLMPITLLELSRLEENRDWLLAHLVPGAGPEDASFYSQVARQMHNLPPLPGSSLSPLHDRLAILCGDILRGVHSDDIQVIQEALGGLIGLGKGLTPSGDDIVSGFISALHGIRPPAGRGGGPADAILGWFPVALAEKKETTTFLSGHFMTWIAEGRLPEEMRKLLSALCCGAPGDAGPWLAHFLSLGASSGREMMVGVALAMSLLIQGTQGLHCTET